MKYNETETIKDQKVIKRYCNELLKVVKKNDSSKTLKLLGHTEIIRTLIVLRGKNNAYINLLHDFFKFVLKNESLDELLVKIHKNSISEIIFIQIMAVAYRVADEKMHTMIQNFIRKNQDRFLRKSTYAEMLHEQAAWENMINKNYAEALKLNNEALALCKKHGYKLLETKVRFGITLNKSDKSTKNLRVSDQLKDYQQYADLFYKLGDEYHSLRARIEMYLLQLQLIRQQTDLKITSAQKIYTDLLKLHAIAKKDESFYLLMKIKYALSKTLDALGQTKKAEQYLHEYEVLKAMYQITPSASKKI